MSKRHSRSKSRGNLIEQKKRSKLLWTFAITLLLVTVVVVVIEKNRRDRLRIENAGQQFGRPEPFIVAASRISELRTKYEDLVRNRVDSSNPAKISYFEERLEICSKISNSATEPADIEFSKREQLQTHAAYYKANILESIGVKNLSAPFEEVIKSLKADKNGNLRKLAFLAGIEKKILDYLSVDDPGTVAPALEEEFTDLQLQFPDQFDVAARTSDLLPFFKIQPDKATRIEHILDLILQTWGKSTNTTIQTWLTEILDAKKLVSLNFFSLDLLCRNPTLSDALPASELIMESSRLAIGLQLGATGLEAILDVAEQFEINDWYDKAGELYRMTQEHLKTRTDLADQARLVSRCTFGLTRIALLTQPLNFSDTDMLGKEISNQTLSGKVVLFVYIDGNEHLAALIQFVKQLSQMHEFGLETVILFGRDKAKLNVEELKEIQTTIRVILDPELTSSLFQACPVTDFPYMMFVDRAGRVVDINVSQQELLLQAEGLLFQN